MQSHKVETLKEFLHTELRETINDARTLASRIMQLAEPDQEKKEQKKLILYSVYVMIYALETFQKKYNAWMTKHALHDKYDFTMLQNNVSL